MILLALEIDGEVARADDARDHADPVAFLLEVGSLLDVRFEFDPWPHLAAITGTAVLANLAGWMASFQILGRKPLAVMRGE